ncbi:MAG: type II toxin-antitoxin system PemK/MazF family toxin [Deltaproteobacteria bacterium]|nr:type II toxin-antitoxin system PemK/MazF family toxin [Deltaproteobacteria bacterium]MBI4373723.1 type II toxin-antitoxin system PemK/MazF family toxin [Deltaproteobacteria bacterium]
MEIRYGHLYTADLNPRHGTEPGKVRPVLVIQTDLLNQTGHSSTLVCLLTTQVRAEADILRVHLKKGESGLKEDSDIMIDQVRAIDNRRLVKNIGKLSPFILKQVQERLKILFEL